MSLLYYAKKRTDLKEKVGLKQTMMRPVMTCRTVRGLDRDARGVRKKRTEVRMQRWIAYLGVSLKDKKRNEVTRNTLYSSGSYYKDNTSED